jgi:hypothetical protein
MGSSWKNKQGSTGIKINPMLPCLFFRLDLIYIYFFFWNLVYDLITVKLSAKNLRKSLFASFEIGIKFAVNKKAEILLYKKNGCNIIQIIWIFKHNIKLKYSITIKSILKNDCFEIILCIFVLYTIKCHIFLIVL